MARMFPAKFPRSENEGSFSRAEKQLYDGFRDQLSDEWVVYFGRKFVAPKWRNRAPEDGEIDFLVGHPEMGILVIEVKGGSIRFDGEDWYSCDMFGREHRIKDPFEQSSKNLHALVSLMERQPEWQGRHVADYAVAFPETDTQPLNLPVHAPRGIIIDQRDLDRLPGRLNDILKHWSGQRPRGFPNGAGVLASLDRVLVPRPPIGLLISDAEKAIEELTREQERTLDLLAWQKHAAIFGCAGSGKTYLACTKALQLKMLGVQRVLLTCHNKMIAEELKKRLAGKGIDVEHFTRLCSRLCECAGLPVRKIEALPDEDPRDFINRRSRYFDEELPDLMLRAMEQHPEWKYDAIIVDEGQDFHDLWWLPLQEALKDPKESFFYVFYDDNQKLLEGKRGHVPQELPRFLLRENVRNTRNIHQKLTHFYRGAQDSISRAPAGPTVKMLSYESDEEMARLLDQTILGLMRHADMRANRLVVLTPRSLQKTRLTKITLSNGYQLRQEKCLGEKDISYSNIFRFKGLESAVVIVVEIDEEFRRMSTFEELCYVAFSRPRSHLVLLGKREILGQLQKLG